MKIVQNTPNLLLLRHRPIVVPAFCWLLVASEVGVMVTRFSTLTAYQWVVVSLLAVACAFAGIVSAIGSTFRFDAGSRTLQWSRSGPLSYRREGGQVSLDTIRRVGVEELPPGGDTGPTWRVRIATRSRSLPLTVHFANFGDHEGLARTIRDWLRSAGVVLADDDDAALGSPG